MRTRAKSGQGISGGREAAVSGSFPACGREHSGQLKIVLVGCDGRMGKMLRRSLTRAGHFVSGIDRALRDGGLVLRQEDLESLLPRGDIVMLSLPVTVLESVLGRIAPLLKPEQLLMDVTSVKVFPMRWMEEAHSGPVIGAHPLFGPTPAPEELRVILVRGQSAGEEHCRTAERLFADMGCFTDWATALEHDAGVALAQSLNFAVSASFFSALARNPGVRRFLTPSFKRHLEAARKHLTIDTEMFCEFTACNPCFADAVRQYERILAQAASGDLRSIASEAAGWYREE